MVVIVALLFGATEALLVRNYGLAMAVITPMVMLLGDLGLPADIATATRDRLVETCVGVVVALAVLWGVRRAPTGTNCSSLTVWSCPQSDKCWLQSAPATESGSWHRAGNWNSTCVGRRRQ